MKSAILGACAVLCLTTSHVATAQVATPAIAPNQVAPLPVSSVIAPAANAVLRTGTELPLRLLEELTTQEKKLRPGERFRLETSEPVVVQGVAVIPAGTPAVGEITDVRNKGMWGKSGRFTARLIYMTVNGRQIRLGGEFDDKGTAAGGGAVAVSALVFLPAGFFMTGTSAKLPSGTIVKGFIDEDVPLSMPAQASPVLVSPQVLSVGVTADVGVPADGTARSAQPAQ